jgi:hypothetical protein
MDKMTGCISAEDVKKLMNKIGQKLDGYPAGTGALALCQCLAILMVETKMPMEFVTESLEKMVKALELDETAH